MPLDICRQKTGPLHISVYCLFCLCILPLFCICLIYNLFRLVQQFPHHLQLLAYRTGHFVIEPCLLLNSGFSLCQFIFPFQHSIFFCQDVSVFLQLSVQTVALAHVLCPITDAALQRLTIEKQIAVM